MSIVYIDCTALNGAARIMRADVGADADGIVIYNPPQKPLVYEPSAGWRIVGVDPVQSDHEEIPLEHTTLRTRSGGYLSCWRGSDTFKFDVADAPYFVATFTPDGDKDTTTSWRYFI